jgi:hypothetical protein
VSGAVFGVLAGLAHLTKASALPLVLIVLAVTAVGSAVQVARGLRHQPGDRRKALTLGAVRAAAIALAIVSVAAVIYPYVATSKRVYGRWFYNVNTTFYVWYNNWPEASVGTYAHGDGVGWPTLPAHQIPTARSYLRTHSPETILTRIADGMADIVVRLYRTFWVLKYVGLYLALAAVAIARNRLAFARLLSQHASLAAFLGLYGATYLAATAFYAPISGTGTSRFVLAHVAPLLFTVSALLARRPFALSQWTVLGCTLTMGHLHLLVTVSMGLDLAFAIWPRLMTTYGGF